MTNSEENTLQRVLDDLQRAGRDDAVSVGDVTDGLEGHHLGFLLTLLGLIVVMPIIGDIPGAAILCATLVLLAVARAYVGGRAIRAPSFVRHRKISRRRFDRGIELARPWVRRVDRLLKPRLTVLTRGRAQRLILSAAAAILALALYPLAFVPFGANAPGAGIMALGLALMTGDGIFALLGYALAGLTVYLLVLAL